METEVGSIRDIFEGSALISAMALVFTIGISSILNRFVALKSLPDKRAMWTVLPGVLISASVCVPMSVGLLPVYVLPFILLPCYIVFWWYRREYRSAWVADDLVSDNMKLENDDWTVGLAGIAILILAGLYRLLWKYFAAG